MKDSDALALAAEVVENGFAKDGYALDQFGRRVGVMSGEARTFCLVGATARVLDGSIDAADEVIDKWLAPLLPPRPVHRESYTFLMYDGRPIVEEPVYLVTPRTWNDEARRTQGEVAAKLREAAERARAAGV